MKRQQPTRRRRRRRCRPDDAADVDDIYDVAGEVDGGLDGTTCVVCCLCLPSYFVGAVVVVVGSSNDATTSFFLDLLPTQPKTRNRRGRERRERAGRGQITVLSFLWRRQGSANHNQAIN